VASFALLLIAHFGACAADRCETFLPKSHSREDAVSLAAGRAVLYRGHPTFGAERATRCFLSVFDPSSAVYDHANVAMVSDALLVLMTVDPDTWFRSAVLVDPSAIDQWLRKPIRLAQLQPMGSCPTPDRFTQAHDAIAGLHFADQRAEDLRIRMVAALKELHCHVAE
jgi:hypothetical protein